ncbi:hypothetical protein K4L44_09970 [Halosquirtibacter laminarini]|uniref:Uncharacterized protein n=1 Tax=Halosquirtibacter laminarini TaxID=3374600 RepID=A0AC61NBU3_9BACT|nr:hypothetical protein K4L44_09970 [Prolixibacteraceae bacterium]
MNYSSQLSSSHYIIISIVVIVLVVTAILYKKYLKKVKQKKLFTEKVNLYNLGHPSSIFQKIVAADSLFIHDWNAVVETYHNEKNQSTVIEQYFMVVNMADHRLRYLKTVHSNTPLIIKIDTEERFGKDVIGVYDNQYRFIGYLPRKVVTEKGWLDPLKKSEIQLIGKYDGLLDGKPRISISVISMG